MAGMQIRPISNSSPMPAVTQVQNVKGPLADAEKPSAQKQEIREQLENVVSKSKDGDTVQVSDKSSEKLEEDAFGRVDILKKEDEAKKAEEEKEKEAEEKEQQRITSFAGLTEDQLEMMYRKGEISKQEYDKQIELKESLKETEEKVEGDTEKMVKGVLASENKMNRDSEEMKAAFSDDSSDTTKAAERINLMDTIEKTLLGIE